MNILIPIEVTASVLSSSTIAEPAPTETAWVSAGTYVVGDLRIRTTTHRVYICILGHTGRTALPEDDTTYWTDSAPTQKWAPFDIYTSTTATTTSSLSYVLTPGFVDAMSFYGLEGSSLSISMKDAPGGTVLDSRTVSLYAESPGLYEYLFAPKTAKTQHIATGFPLRPNAEITVTVTGPATVALGMCNMGQYRSIIGEWGGTQYGASVEPTTFSRIKIDADTGLTTIKRGPAATGMRVSVALPIDVANAALQSVQQVLDVPVSWVSSTAEGFEGLNVFGLGSAVLTYEGPSLARMSINVKGMI